MSWGGQLTAGDKRQKESFRRTLTTPGIGQRLFRDVSAHLLGPWLGPQLQLVPGLVALPGLAQV